MLENIHSIKIVSLIYLFCLTGCASYPKISLSELTKTFSYCAINTPSFLLISYERMGQLSNIANVYIEGDGRAWLNKRTPSRDPTPRNPVALQLAEIDPSDNVIYLARPCQYLKAKALNECDQKYWTSHRFAPEVIDSMDQALDDIKARHAIKKINLIGFSGGGNVVVLLAARRNDILSLRTVAGNLDHRYQSQLHRVSFMSHSLNATDSALYVSHIPQIHFVGAKDRVVPIELYESYKANAGGSSCVNSQVIDKVSHTRGWRRVWGFLLQKSVSCN